VDISGHTNLQDVSCVNFVSDTFRMGNFRYNINVPILSNNISAGAFFIICLNTGGDNECVGRFFFNRSTGHDAAGIVDIVVSSRSTGDTPHGFCSYQTIGGPISSPSPLNFSIMTGTFSGVSYIGLKYEGGDAFPFSEVYFDGIWKSAGNNLPFDMKLNSEVSNQAILPMRAGVLSLQNKRIFIDKDGKVGIGTTTPTATLDVSGNVKVGGTLTVGVNNIYDRDAFHYTGPSGSTTINGHYPFSRVIRGSAINSSGFKAKYTGLYNISFGIWVRTSGPLRIRPTVNGNDINNDDAMHLFRNDTSVIDMRWSSFIVSVIANDIIRITSREGVQTNTWGSYTHFFGYFVGTQ